MTYTGPSEWSYRRFVLHMAKICQLAGGVDMFCLGSEMVAMTRARDGAASYPFVDGLIDLAGEVRSMLGAGTRIGYAADWSEYHSHRPDDGSGDVLFNLDPLWANAEIDFIGIDNCLPLADWRDGTEHLDYSNAGPTTIYDQEYLQANVEGGEHYDWFYAMAVPSSSRPRGACRRGELEATIASGAGHGGSTEHAERATHRHIAGEVASRSSDCAGGCEARRRDPAGKCRRGGDRELVADLQGSGDGAAGHIELGIVA